MAENRKLRMGLAGGGPGAFIGAVHRMAAELDGRIEMVAGAFSSSAEKSKAAGVAYRIDPARAYASYAEMFAREKEREDGIDFVVIATPNNTHLPIAKAALAASIPVMSDKPATATYDEVLELEKLVKAAGLPYGLTHTYAGYALVRDARALCRAGELGEIRKVAVEYFQGWLSQPIEKTGQKQAGWRVDPALSGPGGCIGDIGTHAFHLIEYVTGLQTTAIHGTLRSVVEGRRVDDDCTALLKLNNGAQATLLCSQIATGERNSVRIRVYGTKASLSWAQEDPNYLHVRQADGREEIRHAAGPYLSADARAVTRFPGGHPEGYGGGLGVLYGVLAEGCGGGGGGKENPLPRPLRAIGGGGRERGFMKR